MERNSRHFAARRCSEVALQRSARGFRGRNSKRAWARGVCGGGGSREETAKEEREDAKSPTKVSSRGLSRRRGRKATEKDTCQRVGVEAWRECSRTNDRKSTESMETTRRKNDGPHLAWWRWDNRERGRNEVTCGVETGEGSEHQRGEGPDLRSDTNPAPGCDCVFRFFALCGFTIGKRFFACKGEQAELGEEQEREVLGKTRRSAGREWVATVAKAGHRQRK
ncbi:hypothetical protein ERJ75_001103300 [Trypanosoma vivax]|nr:hypothetical protein ERJ75_001103400 [Trypanosoma vivax]KAH8610422.1 hypothetical protein ERJ75_001103300 [Trypanosoma vivax]